MHPRHSPRAPTHGSATPSPPLQFAFSQFLSWSDQPIYVLEKDNDLDIAELARRNAADILKVGAGRGGAGGWGMLMGAGGLVGCLAGEGAGESQGQSGRSYRGKEEAESTPVAAC